MENTQAVVMVGDTARGLTSKTIFQQDWKRLLSGLFQDRYGHWTISGCSLPGKTCMHLGFPVKLLWLPWCLRNHVIKITLSNYYVLCIAQWRAGRG